VPRRIRFERCGAPRVANDQAKRCRGSLPGERQQYSSRHDFVARCRPAENSFFRSSLTAVINPLGAAFCRDNASANSDPGEYHARDGVGPLCRNRRMEFPESGGHQEQQAIPPCRAIQPRCRPHPSTTLRAYGRGRGLETIGARPFTAATAESKPKVIGRGFFKIVAIVLHATQLIPAS